jgi:uncharacterized protein DUF4189
MKMKIKLVLLTALLLSFSSIGLVQSRTMLTPAKTTSRVRQASFRNSDYGVLYQNAAMSPLSAMSFHASRAEGKSRDFWGAIAYSFSTRAVGFSYNHPTQQDAINAAVEECDEDDCKALVWFKNSCGAFANATGDDKGYGVGIDEDEDVAQEKALANCRKFGTRCKIFRWQCTTR